MPNADFFIFSFYDKKKEIVAFFPSLFFLLFFFTLLPSSLTKFTLLPVYLVISFLIGQVILLFGNHNDPIDMAL